MAGAVYRYTAKDAAGASRKGVISAPSEAEAAEALSRAGLEAGDMDVVELNEAFSSQAIASLRDLGLDAERVGVYMGTGIGGAHSFLDGYTVQMLYHKKAALAEINRLSAVSPSSATTA